MSDELWNQIDNVALVSGENNDAVDLLAEVERLRGENAELRQQLVECKDKLKASTELLAIREEQLQDELRCIAASQQEAAEISRRAFDQQRYFQQQQREWVGRAAEKELEAAAAQARATALEEAIDNYLDERRKMYETAVKELCTENAELRQQLVEAQAREREWKKANLPEFTKRGSPDGKLRCWWCAMRPEDGGHIPTCPWSFFDQPPHAALDAALAEAEQRGQEEEYAYLVERDSDTGCGHPNAVIYEAEGFVLRCSWCESLAEARRDALAAAAGWCEAESRHHKAASKSDALNLRYRSDHGLIARSLARAADTIHALATDEEVET